jgi:hypothetical protein
MQPLDLVRQALAENSTLTAAELSSHIEEKHGVKIEPRYIPLFKATLQQMEKTTQFRQESASHSLT